MARQPKHFHIRRSADPAPESAGCELVLPVDVDDVDDDDDVVVVVEGVGLAPELSEVFVVLDSAVPAVVVVVGDPPLVFLSQSLIGKRRSWAHCLLGLECLTWEQ